MIHISAKDVLQNLFEVMEFVSNHEALKK